MPASVEHRDEGARARRARRRWTWACGARVRHEGVLRKARRVVLPGATGSGEAGRGARWMTRAWPEAELMGPAGQQYRSGASPERTGTLRRGVRSTTPASLAYPMKLRWLLLGLLVTLLLVPAGVLTAARVLDLPGGTWRAAGRVHAVRPGALPPRAAAPAAGLGPRPRLLAGYGAAARAGCRWSGSRCTRTGPAAPFVGGASAEAASTARRCTVMTANLRFGRADVPQRRRARGARRTSTCWCSRRSRRRRPSGLHAAGVGQAFRHRAGRPAAGAGGTLVFSRTRLSRVRRVPTKFASYAMDVRLPGVHGARGGRVHLLAVHPLPPIGDVSGWRADQLVVAPGGPGARRAHGAGRRPQRDDGPRLAARAGRARLPGRRHAGAVRLAAPWPSAGVVSRFGVDVPPLVAIDHVFVKDGLRAQRTETFGVDGTDHRALVATLAR